MKPLFLFVLAFILCSFQPDSDKETFSPIESGIAPQNLEELWTDFDPRKEPLDTEVLYEWEEDGVVMKVLRYRIGIFKGQKAMMAAIYGYPKGAEKLPGLVQIHGGGQYAHYQAVLTNARRGYATISISWAGRIDAPDYRVNPEIVKLFWEGDTANSSYKISTDWGALDGYHAPCRNPGNNFGSVSAAPWTLDSLESPRNNPWFLSAVGARRALTFLEQQAEVDPDRLGVYGHSMGGKLTVLTASDPRVKAAAPSCGGISNNDNENPLYQNTIADEAYLAEITCPIIFLSPSNDFHGHLKDVPGAVSLIQTEDWRVVSSPHHNHQDNGNSEVTGLLWFDQYLKGTFRYPETPETLLELKTVHGVPSFTVEPDPSKPIISVDIYYTQQGEGTGNVSDRENRINRFWHHAKAKNDGKTWTADLPLLSTDKPLWAYANVLYALSEPVTGAGYYYRVYTTEEFNLSSPVQMAGPDQLSAAGVRATMKPSLLIEDFEGDWKKEWYAYKPDKWELKTHKLYCERWKAPEHARLVFELRCTEANKLVVGIDKYASEVELKGGNKWQQHVLSAGDFKNAKGEELEDWSGIMEFRFSATESFIHNADGEFEKTVLGAEWIGEMPEFRELKWIDHIAPNIIFLMADDLGYGDTGFNGNEVIKTPHLDKMAKDGIRFSRFYSIGPVCAPTRASCLTGRHYMRFGMMNVNVGKLPEQEITLASVCKARGYATGHFGKWHLGCMSRTESPRHKDPAGDYAPPWTRDYDDGFATEISVPTWNPASGKFEKHDSPYWHNGKKVTENLEGDDSRVIMDRAIPFIKKAVDDGKPFMTTIWFHSPHSPVVAGPDYLKMYDGYTEGQQHYYGCITALDAQIGRLRSELRKLGIDKNTMIWFCSDNGPEGTGTPKPVYDAYGGAFCGKAGGLRGRKRSLYNGGVCVPAIAVWPGTVTRGRTVDMPCSTLDYLPTLCEAIGFDYPDERPIDGESLLPMLQGKMKERKSFIPFASIIRTPRAAIIQEDFKLCTNLSASGSEDELYHLHDDPAEENNLIAAHSQLAESMKAQLRKWVISCRRSFEGDDYGEPYESQGRFLIVETEKIR